MKAKDLIKRLQKNPEAEVMLRKENGDGWDRLTDILVTSKGGNEWITLGGPLPTGKGNYPWE